MGNILKKALNPLHDKGMLDPVGPKSNPFTAAYDAKKNDGNVMNAIFDPSGKMLKQPATPRQIAAEKKKKRDEMYARAGKKPPTGMKKGGKVKAYKKGGKVKPHTPGDCCRGMGAATRGGKFRKDG